MKKHDLSKLKNYTSEVPAMRSVARIEELLAEAGALGVMKEYSPDGNGKPISITFKMEIPHTGMTVIKLPANVPMVHETMWRDYKSGPYNSRKNKTSKDFEAQAERTAWRIMQDWVEVQLSLIKLNQIDALQAFLPYCFDGTHTLYEKAKAGGFAALLPAPKPEPSTDTSKVIEA